MPNDDGIKIITPDLKVSGGAMEIKKLQLSLDEKELFINKTSREKAKLEVENSKLRTEVLQKTNEIKNFVGERISIEEKYQAKNLLNQKLIAEKDTEIIRLNERLKEISSSRNSDEVVLKELINTKIQFQEVNLRNNINLQELVETKSNLARGEEKLRKMTYEIENLNKIIDNQQLESINAKNELDLIRSKVKKSFTAKDMSGYFNSAIESFNSHVNEVDSAVNYVINEMDVELKAQVYVDEQSQMKLSSADLASKSEDSLSSIKFSIRAVPKL